MTLTDAIEGNPCDREWCKAEEEEFLAIVRQYPGRRDLWDALVIAAQSLQPERLQ